MASLESMLAEHPFLHGLDARYFQTLAECTAEAHFDEDEYLFRVRERAGRFHLLLTGKVALKMALPHVGPIPILTQGPGDAVGWSWLVPPYTWHYDARALEPVHTLALDTASLRRTFEDCPDLGCQFLKRMTLMISDRFQAMRSQLLEVYEVRV